MRSPSPVAGHRDELRSYDQAERAVLAFSGAILSLAGLVLAIGGYLSSLGGSAFHMLIGAGLLVAGLLVASRHRAGIWVYLVVFAGTLAWSLRNIAGGASLAHSLFGPAILLATLAALMPVLARWRASRAIRSFAIIATVMIALGLASAARGPLSAPTAPLTHSLDAQAKGVSQ